MNPPLDLADSPIKRSEHLSARGSIADSSSSALTSDAHHVMAIERAPSNEDTSFDNTRVRQLTALVSKFATHKEVLALVENYREPYSPIAKRPLPDSPVRRDLSVYRLLDKKEEQALGYQIDNGLEAYNAAEFTKTSHIIGAVAAHQTLVVCNLRFVYHLAKYYSDVTPASREQVYQWGVYGLLRAAKKYNASLGNRFTTLARNEIKDVAKKQIRKEIRQQDLGGLLVLNEHVYDDSETEFIETLPDALSAPPEEEFFQGMDPVIEIINGMGLKERDHEIAIGLAAGLTVRELVDKIGITDQAIRVRMKKLRPKIAEAFGRFPRENLRPAA